MLHKTKSKTINLYLFSEMQSFIDDQRIAKGGFNPLIGITDLVEEGTFAFVDNTYFDYANPKTSRLYSWLFGEPNNYMGSEDCVQLLFTEYLYTLNDVRCSERSYAVCEVKNITCTY